MVAIRSLPTSDYQLLRTAVGLPSNSRVDRERKIIFGVSMLQKGDLNDDRPWTIDDVSIAQVIKLTKSNPKGAKSRFTHPNMSNDGLGKFIGRMRKPRRSEDGQHALANLHLAPIAFKTTIEGMSQSLGDHILDLADNDPDVFGLSLAPKLDQEAMRELERRGQRTPMRFAGLHAVDVVDEPAATRGGIFGGMELSIGNAPKLASESLDKIFAGAEEEVIRQRVDSFLNTYLANRFHSQDQPLGEDIVSELTMKEVQEAIDKSLASSKESLLSSIKELLPQKESSDSSPQPDGPTSAEMAKRASELTALAQLSGLEGSDELLSNWMKDLSSDSVVLDAHKQVNKLLSEQNSLTDGDPNPDDGGQIDAKLSAAYEQNASVHKGLGLSKAEWIKHAKKQIERDAEAAA